MFANSYAIFMLAFNFNQLDNKELQLIRIAKCILYVHTVFLPKPNALQIAKESRCLIFCVKNTFAPMFL